MCDHRRSSGSQEIVSGISVFKWDLRETHYCVPQSRAQNAAPLITVVRSRDTRGRYNQCHQFVGCVESKSEPFFRLKMLKFAGKVAVITGATSGIGKETATHFASLGCRVSITGRNEQNLNETKQKCLSNGLKENDVFTSIGDVTNEKFCKQFMDNTVKHFGKLDVLVNNAGILRRGTAENTDLELYDFLFKTNVRSLFVLTQLAIPHLRKTKGNIVNVSSVNGLRAFAGVCVYNMTKTAVDQLTRSTALELAADGVRVNAVNPGVTLTQLHKTGGLNEEEYAKFLEHSKTTHALGRAGTVDEIAKAIAFLASSDASFITGASLPVDGGRHQLCPR